MDVPMTWYAHTEHGDIAYQTLGNGPHDLLIVQPMSRCLDAIWDYPASADTLRRLASRHRVILFDRRGSGISDPLPVDLPPTWEDWLEDIVAVLDAVDSHQAVVLAEREAAAAAVLFAGDRPERVRALVLGNTSSRFRVAPGYACGEGYLRVEQLCAHWEQRWGTEELVRAMRPTLAGDPAYLAWAARMQRATYTPRRASEVFRYVLNFDARAVLGAILAPTLVLHRRDLQLVPLEQGRCLAEHIAGACLEVLPGSDLDILVPGDPQPLMLIEDFLARLPQSSRADGKPPARRTMGALGGSLQ